ncbi:MAG: T9SS type A sorting domain-containing protein [Bacteroidota bacterium]
MRTSKQLLFILSFLLSATFAFSQTIDWQVHQGQGAGIFTPGPDDPPIQEILNELTGGKQPVHGDPGGFQYAEIPPANDAGWEPAPIDEDGDLCWRLDRSRLDGFMTALDFTYFQTTVNVTDASEPFILRFFQVDDGARAYVFNSVTLQDPENAFIEGGDARLYAPIAVTDISSLFVEGEPNRIVIVQFDDSQTANFLKVEVLGGDGIGEEICGGGQIDRPIVAGEDDVEQGSDGTMLITSRDLEMVDDDGLNLLDQVIGLRFTDIAVPSNATIKEAYIQFSTDIDDFNSNADPTSLNIALEAGDSAPFTEDNNDLTNRFYILENIAWNNIPAWTINEEAGEDQRTPDLSTLIQELITLSTWNEGGAMTFLLEGTGSRSAKSFEGGAAPRLFIRYEIECENVEECDDDTEAPALDLSLIVLDTLACIQPENAPTPIEVSATDNCDSNPSVEVQIEFVPVEVVIGGGDDPFNDRPIRVGTLVNHIYTATDVSGNTVMDTIAAHYVEDDREAPILRDASPLSLYSQDFENPNGFVASTFFNDASGQDVRDLYGQELKMRFTTETLSIDGSLDIYTDPDGRGGDYSLAIWNGQDDLLGLTFDTQGKEFLNVKLDLSAIALTIDGGISIWSNTLGETTIPDPPLLNLKLYDDPNQNLDIEDPMGTILDEITLEGIEVGETPFTFNWKEVIASLDASGSTNDNVTLVFDLLGVNNAYAAMDNIEIEASNVSSVDGIETEIEITCLSELPEALVLIADDNCDGEVGVSFSQSTINTEINDQVITRTWSAMDEAGNDVSIMQTITVNAMGEDCSGGININNEIDQFKVAKTHLDINASPNPFRTSTIIDINLPKGEWINLEMRDISGRLAKQFTQEGFKGVNSFSIQRDDLATGVYFVSARTASTQQTVKVIVTQ